MVRTPHARPKPPARRHYALWQLQRFLVPAIFSEDPRFICRINLLLMSSRDLLIYLRPARPLDLRASVDSTHSFLPPFVKR